MKSKPSKQVKYTVERLIPPDGLVGCHLGEFDVEDLAKKYGEGSYKILKHEPGKPSPMGFIQKVSATYGPPKFPKAETASP